MSKGSDKLSQERSGSFSSGALHYKDRSGESTEAPVKQSWFKRAVKAVGGFFKKIWKAMTSNAGATLTATVGVIIAPFTGGASLAVTAVAVGAIAVKVAKTGLDAAKAFEKDKIIDLCNALTINKHGRDMQNTLLGYIAPNGDRIKGIASDGDRIREALGDKLSQSSGKTSENKGIKINQTLNIASKVTNLVNSALDLTTAVLDPTKLAAVTQKLQEAINSGAEMTEIAKSSVELLATTSENAASVQAVRELRDTIEDAFKKDPKLLQKIADKTQEDPVKINTDHNKDTKLKDIVARVNSELAKPEVHYENIVDLMNQNRQTYIENKALKGLLKENTENMTQEQIREKFDKAFKEVEARTPEVQNKSDISKFVNAVGASLRSKDLDKAKVQPPSGVSMGSDMRRKEEATKQQQVGAPLRSTMPAPQDTDPSVLETAAGLRAKFNSNPPEHNNGAPPHTPPAPAGSKAHDPLKNSAGGRRGGH